MTELEISIEFFAAVRTVGTFAIIGNGSLRQPVLNVCEEICIDDTETSNDKDRRNREGIDSGLICKRLINLGSIGYEVTNFDRFSYLNRRFEMDLLTYIVDICSFLGAMVPNLDAVVWSPELYGESIGFYYNPGL